MLLTEKVEQLECTTSVFLNDELFFKEIECVRLDGGADGGPVHHEVQFLSTERHVVKPTKITLVTILDAVVTVILIESSCKTDVLVKATATHLFRQRYVVLHSVKTERLIRKN